MIREGFALNSPIFPWRMEGQYSRIALSRAARSTYAEGRSSGGGPLLILASVHPQPHAHALSPPLAPFLAPSRCPLAEPAG